MFIARAGDHVSFRAGGIDGYAGAVRMVPDPSPGIVALINGEEPGR